MQKAMAKPPQPETTATTGKAQGSGAGSGTEYVSLHHAASRVAQPGSCTLDQPGSAPGLSAGLMRPRPVLW